MAVKSTLPSSFPVTTFKISLTNECNLKCLYCDPLNRYKDAQAPAQTLQPGELQRIIRAGTALGITRAIIAGGEPLLRKDCPNLVKAVVSNRNIEDVRLITNGTYLKTYADQLHKTGLRRVEVNVDSLNFLKYQKLTGKDNLYRVLDGIKKAEECGFNFIRINMLVLKGVNEDELIDFAVMTKEKPYHIYFCEYRPDGNSENKFFMPSYQIKEIINHFQPIFPIHEDGPDGIVTRYKFADSKGTINFFTNPDITRIGNAPRLVVNSAGEIYMETNPSKKISIVKLGGKDANEEKLSAQIQKLIQASTNVKKSESTTPKSASKPKTPARPHKAKKTARAARA